MLDAVDKFLPSNDAPAVRAVVVGTLGVEKADFMP